MYFSQMKSPYSNVFLFGFSGEMIEQKLNIWIGSNSPVNLKPLGTRRLFFSIITCSSEDKSSPSQEEYLFFLL